MSQNQENEESSTEKLQEIFVQNEETTHTTGGQIHAVRLSLGTDSFVTSQRLLLDQMIHLQLLNLRLESLLYSALCKLH